MSSVSFLSIFTCDFYLVWCQCSEMITVKFPSIMVKVFMFNCQHLGA